MKYRMKLFFFTLVLIPALSMDLAQAQMPGARTNTSNRGHLSNTGFQFFNLFPQKSRLAKRAGFSLMPAISHANTSGSRFTLAPMAAAGNLPVFGNGTSGRLTRWTGFTSSNSAIGDSNIYEDKFGLIGIGTDSPTSRLTVMGLIESAGGGGGFKFADGTIQTTAGFSSIFHDGTLMGNGTSGSPLGIAPGGVGTTHLANNSVTGAKLANGTVVRSLNGLFDNVTVAAGPNITITPSGNTLTIASSGGGGGGGLTSVATDSTLAGNGTSGSPLRIALPLNLSGAGPLTFPNDLVRIENTSNGGNGAHVTGGNDTSNSSSGHAGNGLTAFGGRSTSGHGGIGTDVRGGDSTSGFGGNAVTAVGGHSQSLKGGFGVFAQGGNSTSGEGGMGLEAFGGDGGSGMHGSAGVRAEGGSGLGAIGGFGVLALAGSSDSDLGGVGLRAIGGASNSTNGGLGVEASGGVSFNGEGGFGADIRGGASTNSLGGIGIVVFPGTGPLGTGAAAVFHGAVTVLGDLNVAGTKNFKIDHPLDPENKYLIHAAIESSEVLNVYSGNVVTDANGKASVALPEWFDSVNKDLRYQLTVIGTFAQAIVGEKVKNNRFIIKTNAPNVEVSWQVTGVRSDAAMRKHPFKVEQDKTETERGFYLSPDAFGQPEEKAVDWARQREMLTQTKEQTGTAKQTRARQ